MSSKTKAEKKRRVARIIVIFFITLCLGCYMLFFVSRSYKPILGNTFHILTGCIFISVSALVLFVTIKNYFFPKRRKKRSNVVFLEDELRKIRKNN